MIICENNQFLNDVELCDYYLYAHISCSAHNELDVRPVHTMSVPSASGTALSLGLAPTAI